MKILKNRFVALLLTISVVCASTCLSIRWRMEKESTILSMGFYNGVASAAETEPTLDAVLKDLCHSSDTLIRYAQQNGLPADALKETTSSLSYHLSIKSMDYSQLHSEYVHMLEEMQALSSLIQTDAPNSELTESVRIAIDSARQMVQSASYNQSVRNYLSSQREYALMFARMFDPILPEFFA